MQTQVPAGTRQGTGRKGASLSLGRASGAGGSAARTKDVEIANRKEIVNKAPDPHPLLPHVLIVGSNDFILSLGEPNRGDRGGVAEAGEKGL